MNRILTLIALLFITYGCCKEYQCDGFNHKNPFMGISISPDLEEEIVLQNDYNDELILTKSYEYMSNSYVDKSCNKRYSGCFAEFNVNYQVIDSDDYFRIWISEKHYFYDNNNEIRFDFESSNFRTISYFNHDYDEISEMINSLITVKVDKGIEYENIYEIIDTVFAKIHTNTVDTIINGGTIEYQGTIGYINDSTNYSIYKLWLQKDKGLIKYWKNDTCWSLK